MNWRIRAIPRDPIDPRALARLFIQMALERADAEHTEHGRKPDAPAS